MTDCPHGFEPRYQDRCALCRRTNHLKTAPRPLPTELDAKQAAANDR